MNFVHLVPSCSHVFWWRIDNDHTNSIQYFIYLRADLNSQRLTAESSRTLTTVIRQYKDKTNEKEAIRNQSVKVV
jgi:hypothetical protein